VGTSEGASIIKARFYQGVTDYYLGTHIVFMLAKSLRRTLLEKPYIIGAAARLAGFMAGCFSSEKRNIPDEVIRYIRKDGNNNSGVMVKTRNNDMKIAIACSTGGHMVQVRQLAPVYEKHEHFYFTFSGPVAEELGKSATVRAIPNVVRYNPLSWIVGAVLSFYIVVVEKPDVVITTGAGIVVFFCVFAKLLGAKLIFIESMARVERPTLTARMLYPFANLFFVQWPNLLKFFPKARYVGRLF